MKQLDSLIKGVDKWQQSHRLTAMTYAVVKKYGNDESSYNAALLTYYGFLALFPLLLVLTTVTSLIAGNHSSIQNQIINGTTNYFPVLGSQLSDHVHGLHKNGIALIVGIVLTLYGARGVADVFQRGIQNIWCIPKSNSQSFFSRVLRSVSIVVVGGAGFIAASIFTGLSTSAGHGLLFKFIALGVHIFILFWLFIYLFNASLPKRISTKDLRTAGLAAAIGLVLLQAYGSHLLKVELQHLDALYSYFAVALGLLFWIYLQAQLIYYAATLAVVRKQVLWPRSFSDIDKK
ncbi:MAG: hypothetical protein NVS1B10_04540 [Candidatus Saccharimonadales bacterium]